jgi:hypothetical protein
MNKLFLAFFSSFSFAAFYLTHRAILLCIIIILLVSSRHSVSMTVFILVSANSLKVENFSEFEIAGGQPAPFKMG